ncbi:MAG: ATP-binding protein [Oscillospiraceae bacterium]|nr:ATP-binding protein [Oscillospiraceae bacterium]
MGSYLNPDSVQFRDRLNSRIYVDKSGLIAKTNAVFRTGDKYICLSRPRRFGKSMAADMLAAYYGCGEDTAALFDGLKISADPSYREHLNRHDVIKVNMQEFLSYSRTGVDGMLALLQKEVIAELRRAYSEVDLHNMDILALALRYVYAMTHRSFVILIDEWDCIFREHKSDKASQEKYLDFLRALLKDQAYVGLVYMTGILPIKKYGTHSALNMFSELSMTNPGGLAEFFGFTEAEVQALCDQYHMPFEEAQAWYDGYHLVEYRLGKDGAPGQDVEFSMYNPNSVVQAMVNHRYDTYWNNTETYEALKVYICMNLHGLKDSIIQMLAGARVRISTGTFRNDMTSLDNRNDVLTLLVHLGYLTYDFDERGVSIPNREVSEEFINAISTTDWSEVIRAVEDSYALLKALWNMDETAVAAGIDRAHESVSILQYNDENALSYAIGLAFYSAMEYYTIIREMPSGKGYADVVYIPRRLYADKPAVVIELKYDKSAEGAIAQIKEKRYPAALAEYHGNLLLCGISYDRESKAHQCRVERLEV